MVLGAPLVAGITDYAYTGPQIDVATGLYFYQARWYDPALGRFISADTVVPEPGNPQSLNRYAYVQNNPLKYTDPTGHTDCIDADCAYVSNPISGEILQHLRIQTDPIFGDKDFPSRNPIPAYTGINPFFINGWIGANKLQQVSDEYNVPGELIATVLQLENNPRFGVWGVSRRAIKVRMTPYLQIVDPQHAADLGYSQGVGNMKPGVAQENSEYFMDYYPGEQSVERYWTHFQLGSPGHNVEHIAAHLRKQIDSIYWFGYEGPMSIEGMALVITKYNSPIRTSPSGYGLEGRALLMDASKGAANLIFWRQ